MNDNHPTPLKVAIGWSRGAGLVSRLIRRLDAPRWDGRRLPSAINHVYLKFWFLNGLVLVFESHFKGGVQITPWSHVARAQIAGKVEWVYEKALDLDAENRRKVWGRCEALHGQGYDSKLILVYYLWIRVFGRRPDAKWLPRVPNNAWTCNELVVWALRALPDYGVALSYKTSLTPEALFRMFVGDPSQLIYEREVLGR